MQRRRRQVAWSVALGVIAIGASAIFHPAPFLVWNASASVPVGLYLRAPAATIRRGDLVLARLPKAAGRMAADRGYLPAAVPLVKPIAATAGDTVCAIGDSVSIDGREVARRLETDSKGRPMPSWSGCRTLQSGEVFLLAKGVPDSFDGRYFGPIKRSQIVGKLVPLWIL